jgi:hypothetical protein
MKIKNSVLTSLDDKNLTPVEMLDGFFNKSHFSTFFVRIIRDTPGRGEEFATFLELQITKNG